MNSVEHLAPRIRQILSAPDTDLSTVSAKHVRRQLLELDQDITLEYIKEHKEAIDALIGRIFELLNNPNGSDVGEDLEYAVTANGKRKREDEGDEQEEEPSAPRTPKKQKKGKGISDEEYARQLSSELNQRPSRSGRNPNGTSKKGASRTPKKVKKSREQIDDDSDQEADAGEGSSRKRKKATKKKTGSGEAKGGFAKEFTLSEPLAAVLETPQLSRPQVVKRLWQYIKQHELQNPKNKKEILCDDALRAVFNSDKIDMFGMNKTLGQHLYEPDS